MELEALGNMSLEDVESLKIEFARMVRITVARDGDVMLIIDEDTTDTKFLIQVSSSAMSRSSPVFRSLLESYTINQHFAMTPRTYRITVPSDVDVHGLYMLCCILHLRNDLLPERIAPTQACKLVGLAVKYDCIAAITRAAAPWIEEISKREEDLPLGDLIDASVLLDLAGPFARFTSRYVLNWIPEIELDTNKIWYAGSTDHARAMQGALDRRRRELYVELKLDLKGLTGLCEDELCTPSLHRVCHLPSQLAKQQKPAQDQDRSGVHNDSRQKSRISRHWPRFGKNKHAENLKSAEPSTQEAQSRVCHAMQTDSVMTLYRFNDARLWPVKLWSSTDTLGCMIERLRGLDLSAFAAEYDSGTCESCLPILAETCYLYEDLMDMYENKLWGLCLDCYNTGRHLPSSCRKI